MAFVKKTWLQRIVDFPGRRKLAPTEIANTYDVTRDEGNIIQAGDGLTAVNLNDLENRIEAAINERIEKIMIVQNAISTNPNTVASGPALKAVKDEVNTLNNNLTSLGELSGYVVCGQVQGGYVTTSMIPLYLAINRGITITSGLVAGEVVLTTEELAMLAFQVFKTGFNMQCADATLNAKIADKSLSVTFNIS